jgi:hypothetical protein
MRLRRQSNERLLDRRTATLLRGVLLYSATAVLAGLFGWMIVLLSATAP